MSAPVITLLTDFGTADGYVAAMKGVVLSLAPAARLFDIGHEIDGCDVVAGALALESSAPLFPAGSIHLAVVDPGVGGARAPLLVESGGRFYVGPDNGLLSLAASPPRTVRRLANDRFFRLPLSDTFHGRDLFAPVAGHLAAGRAPAEFGPAADGMQQLALPEPTLDGGSVRGEVLVVDRFGNLITNISDKDLPAARDRCRVRLGEAMITGISAGYFQADSGSLVAVISSRGTLEIAVKEGSAAGQTRSGRGTGVVVESG